jgi:acyl-CoA reductase-like NAD-dependent aldehyde dehydrogenase
MMPLLAAQKEWEAVSIRDRLCIVRKIRSAIAGAASQLADLFAGTLERTRADSLTSEIIPPAEACRFLELEAARILASRRLSKRDARSGCEALRSKCGMNPWAWS